MENALTQNETRCQLMCTYWKFVLQLQIWDAVEDKQGQLSRNGLYKALALTALAQQGKAINEKILETYSDQG